MCGNILATLTYSHLWYAAGSSAAGGERTRGERSDRVCLREREEAAVPRVGPLLAGPLSADGCDRALVFDGWTLA